MSMLTIPHRFQSESASLKTSVKDGKYAEALRALDSMTIYVGVAACFEMQKRDPRGFEKLAGHAKASGNHSWGAFYAMFVANGHMPRNTTNMTPDFRDTARKILLKEDFQHAYGKGLFSNQVSKRRATASTQPFYPEYMHLGRRQRVCQIARDHADIGPLKLRQALLFSLGGLYKWTWAEAGTNPINNGTTCFLFVRSVLQAAGCNVIGGKTSGVVCSCPNGFAELPGSKFNYGWTDAPKPPVLPTAKPGDVFLIDKGKMKSHKSDDLVSSSHVGVIVAVNGTRWEVVEGGDPSHVTKNRFKNLIVEDDRWVFEEDTKTSAGRRPISGWLSIDNINASNWMA